MIKTSVKPVIPIANNVKTSLNVRFVRITSSSLTISVLIVVLSVCIRTPITPASLARRLIVIYVMKKNALNAKKILFISMISASKNVPTKPLKRKLKIRVRRVPKAVIHVKMTKPASVVNHPIKCSKTNV